MEPPRKRRKATHLCESIIREDASRRASISSLSSDVSGSSIESPFSPPPTLRKSSNLTACDFIPDITNYIPAGCLRLERHKCQVTADAWKSCGTWQWFGHPREIIDPDAGPFLQNVLQEQLLKAPCVQPYRTLHQSGWIRLGFKIRDMDWGQIRVYILPEDIGRRMIERDDNSLRKSLQRLMAELDTARTTWDAEWSDVTPVTHIDSDLNQNKDSEASLFYLFNTLPSPTPDSSAIEDPYAKSAMDRILGGNIKGLRTNMLPYQRRSAAMMLQKEAQPAQLVDPRLRKSVDQNGLVWYCDVITGTCLRTPRMYEAARGGICAETMGLGKTLICLALILATREYSSQIPVEYSVDIIPVRKRVGSLLDMSAATIGRTGTPWKGYFNQLQQDGLEYSKCTDAIRRGAGYYYIPSRAPRRVSRRPVTIPPKKIYLSTATLVVVPTNLVRQWEREIDKHTTGLKVLVMSKNTDELPSAADLSEYDIILFSRQRFERESRDGSDAQGRRESSSVTYHCQCPILHNGERDCNCFRADKVYRSPLRDLHFKRLITDEGHTMGNSNNTTKTNAVIVVDFLQLSSRWIVSGTPTQGLYGADSMPFEAPDTRSATDMVVAAESPSSITKTILDAEQERKDLEKLGNIATTYLKSRPWANTRDDNDSASWSQYVMQPRHGSKSRGNIGCLRNTLEGMIIRHQHADVEKDVELPPLHQKIVYLEGSLQDKLSLNIFSLMITSNAVTSERKDADYLFHPRQRKALGQLVANLRQASFFWCGFTKVDVKFTIDIANKFLAKGEIFTSGEDRYLLEKVVEIGAAALSNSIWLAASENHEMPVYIQSDSSCDIRKAWALDGKDQNPTLVGATQLLSLQKFVKTRLGKHQPLDGLEDAGKAAMALAQEFSAITPTYRSRGSKLQKKLEDTLPALAGGLKVGENLSPKKKQRNLSNSAPHSRDDKAATVQVGSGALPGRASSVRTPSVDQLIGDEQSTANEKTEPERSPKAATMTSSEFSFATATILSTSSSKLSYLVIQVLKHYKSEKIIIFYENDNVAYYIAQVLEAINIEHLIYAKALTSDRRSRYLVTFNQSDRFRVLLMDISQAAFGLDVSSASRVYFVNPVFNKQVEAQAVKRAHRIGQYKPVYVETLVLRDSIEEMIIERRKAMSSDEQKKCKTVLDDQIIYDWIKNVKFVPLPEEDIPGPAQMAQLETPQPAFGHGNGTDGVMHDPDAGLVLDLSPQTPRKFKAKDKGMRKSLPFDGTPEEARKVGDVIYVNSPTPTKKTCERVGFLIDEVEEDESATPSSSSY